MRYPTISARVLATLAGAEWIAGELWDELIFGLSDPSEPSGKRLHPHPGYGPALRRLKHKQAERSAKRYTRLKSRLRYQQTISNLIRSGLVERKGYGQTAHVRRTALGTREYERLAARAQTPDPRGYPVQRSAHTVVTVVSYDIPERDRWKRDWVRAALVAFGYHMVHQSTWVGTQKLPVQFLKDARALRMLHFIEIFEVTKEGTLKNRVHTEGH